MDKFKEFFGDKNIFKGDEEIKRNIYNLFRNLKIKFESECLHPIKKNCNGKPIKSHSIQKSTILKKLSNNEKKIMMFSGNTDAFKGPKFEMKEVGINKATTFLGLCNFHDTETFKLIDIDDFDPENMEKQFLYAYKSVLMNHYQKSQSYERFKYIAKKNDDKNEFVVAKLIFLSYMNYLGFFSSSKIKKIFDYTFIKKNYNDELIYKNVILNYELPIAACSAFTPIVDFNNNVINNFFKKEYEIPKYIFFNIFPENGNTYILICFLKKQKDFLEDYVNYIIKNEDIENTLSNLILRNIENFVMLPEHWYKLNLENRNKIEKFFTDTLINSQTHYISKFHNLFIK
jgi:hypothetical protein